MCVYGEKEMVDEIYIQIHKLIEASEINPSHTSDGIHIVHIIVASTLFMFVLHFVFLGILTLNKLYVDYMEDNDNTDIVLGYTCIPCCMLT